MRLSVVQATLNSRHSAKLEMASTLPRSRQERTSGEYLRRLTAALWAGVPASEVYGYLRSEESSE